MLWETAEHVWCTARAFKRAGGFLPKITQACILAGSQKQWPWLVETTLRAVLSLFKLTSTLCLSRTVAHLRAKLIRRFCKDRGCGTWLELGGGLGKPSALLGHAVFAVQQDVNVSFPFTQRSWWRSPPLASLLSHPCSLG